MEECYFDQLPLEHAPTVREKKATLLEVIELQHSYIEQRGNDEDLHWHKEQGERLEKLKAALNDVRLQPDEFPLLMPQHWVMRKAARASSRDLIPYVLRINARSQLTFLQLGRNGTMVSSAGSGSGDGDVGDGGAVSGGGVDGADAVSSEATDVADGAPRVFFMDQLRHVRLAPAASAAADDETAHILLTPSGSGSGRSSADLRSAAPCALSIDLAGEPPLTCVTAEASELVEVLGAHLRRYNRSCAAQASALKRLHALKCTPFNACDATHDGLLCRLWACGFGDSSKCERHSERWVLMGFQSADPFKDFRGMGVHLRPCSAPAPVQHPCDTHYRRRCCCCFAARQASSG